MHVQRDVFLIVCGAFYVQKWSVRPSLRSFYLGSLAGSGLLVLVLFFYSYVVFSLLWVLLWSKCNWFR